jgi:hypothetical protein
MTMSSKIADQHLARQACIYIRQSTMGQVRFNQESTERQYNLKTKAESLGWKPEQIRILDRDLGQSGSATTNREDFKAWSAKWLWDGLAQSFPWKRRGWRDRTRTGIASWSSAPSPAHS